MSSYEDVPLLSEVTEFDVEADRSLEVVYYEEKLSAIMRGDFVWVRRGFGPNDVISFDLYENRRYLGYLQEDEWGYQVYATGVDAVGFGKITTEPLLFEHAQGLLSIHTRLQEALPPSD